jgi:hypothetical protein
MVVEDHGEDAGQRELQKQRRQRGQRYAQIEVRPRDGRT